jgi:hypothetical protein
MAQLKCSIDIFSSVEAFDVFCFGQILYEISVGTPLYLKVLSSATNNVINQSYNSAVIEGRDALPHQLPDSLSMKQTYFACIPY